MVRARALAAAAILALASAGAGSVAAAPARVVSINLCTDQLAMLLAAPGQLVSVSWLTQDPETSPVAEAAMAYPANHGGAEEIFLMRPDLVLAGSYTARASVSILRRLGVPVIEFAPADSLEEIPARIAQMGAALGREAAAADLAKAFAADLASARRAAEPRPRAALLYANSYTSGAGTLADSIVDAAGLDNIGAELGYVGMARLPLELLIMSRPDLLVEEHRYAAPALAKETFAHPALGPVKARSEGAPIADRDWTCGSPRVVAAVRRLAEAAARLPGR